MASPNEAPAIGIDLGTTFSVAAVHRKSKTEIIVGKRGEHLIPSSVLYSLTNLDVNVGEIAESQILKNIENFLYDIKRIIGRKFDDGYVQELINTKRYKYKIVRGDDDKAVIQLIHNGVLITKSPEEICSEILKHIRVNASQQIGVDIKEAVISVPARFGNAQRKATRTAAELAGFKVLKLITEPVAAAIYYAENAQPNGNLLIVDLGGGTLDISIVKVEDKTFSVKSIEGNPFFGGRDFDFILLNYVKEKLGVLGISEISDRFLHRINKRVIKAKCELSFSENYIEDLTLPRTPRDAELIECEVPISRLEFETLITDLLNDFQTLLNKCLQEAGLTKTDISDAILVGGSTRIPKIRETVRTFLNKEPKTNLNPDEIVALGAAIQAAVLKKTFHDYEKYLFTEITPLFLGYRSSHGLFEIAIPKYSEIPFRSNVISTITSHNNQKEVIIDVYEGQRKNCRYNNLLGSLTIKDLSYGRAGDIHLEIIFSLDNDGILEVEAWETTNMKRNKLTITMTAFGLSDYKAQYELQQAMRNRKEDDIFHICADYRSTVQVICEHINFDLNTVYEEEDKAMVQDTYQKMTSLINQEDLNLSEFRKKYDEFYKIMRPLVSKYNIAIVLKSEHKLYKKILQHIRKYDAVFYGPQCTQ